MSCHCVALGTVELNVVTVIVVVGTVGGIDVGKGQCIEVGRVGT